MEIEKFCPILGKDIKTDAKHPENCDCEYCKFNLALKTKKPRNICVFFKTYLDVGQLKKKIK